MLLRFLIRAQPFDLDRVAFEHVHRSRHGAYFIDPLQTGDHDTSIARGQLTHARAQRTQRPGDAQGSGQRGANRDAKRCRQ